MLIAIDANPLVNDHLRRGIGKTTRRLLEEYGRRSHPGYPFELAYYLPDSAGAWRHPDDWANIRPLRLAPREDICGAALVDGVSLLHLMDYFYPLYQPGRLASWTRRPFRLVITVRDIIPCLFPENKRQGEQRLRENLVPVLDVVDKVIAISRQTRSDLIEHLGVPAPKITVVYHGVDHTVFHDRYPQEQVQETLRRHGLTGPYVLYVSAFDARKNHQLLIASFHRLTKRFGELGLVLVGWPAAPAKVTRQIRELGLEGKVTILHGTAADDLAQLYCGASLFAFPSRYEGFGNPLVEAMACGAPVVALRCSCVPEVAGGAALLVEDDDAATFSDAMAAVLGDEELAGTLRREGKAQAARYTWEQTADLTLEVYRKVLAGSCTSASS